MFRQACSGDEQSIRRTRGDYQLKIYIIVDIGCIECGEETKIVKVTQIKSEAQELATGSYFEGGQHSIEMLRQKSNVRHPSHIRR